MLSESVDLAPFWRSRTSYWKSTEIKDTNSLGYTYADVSREATPSSISFFIRCIDSGFIVELECSMHIQILISGPAQYSMICWVPVTISRSERRKYPEASIVCP